MWTLHLPATFCLQGEAARAFSHLNEGEVISRLTPAPIFRRKLNTPKAAGIEPLDSDLPGRRGPGLANPHDLKLSRKATVEGINRKDLVHRELVSCPQGCPEFADADGFCLFAESLSFRINSTDLHAAAKSEPRRPSLIRLGLGRHERPPSLVIGEVAGCAA